MDREISKEQRNREKRRMWMKWGGTVVVGIVAVIALMQLMQESLHERDIVFSVVDEGSIDVSVSASGKSFRHLKRLSIRPSIPVFWKCIRKEGIR